METLLKDMNPQIEKIQIAVLQKQNIVQKIAQVCALSTTTIRLSKRAVAMKNRSLDDRQINLLFITHQFGKDLADRAVEYLNRKR